MARFFALWAVLVALWTAPAAAETYLLMAEEEGCSWCARWNEDIAHIYPKTPEGRTAPLRRYDIKREAPPATLSGRIAFTPTFLLVQDGVEVGRIEGYPGEDFFWALLGMLLKDAEIELDETG